MADERVVVPLGAFPLVALLRTAEEGVRTVAERLEARGALAGDPETAALLGEIRIWLLTALHRVPEEC